MALRVAAGGLRTPVTVERLSLTRGSMGEVVEDWAAVGTFRARVVPFRGKELLENGKYTASVPVRIFAKYPTIATPADRLRVGSKILTVISVINIDELNREVEITAEEKQ